MAQYKTGTVAVTNGSTTVTGTGTAWLANVPVDVPGTVNPAFRIAGGSVSYVVAAVVSNTQLTLSEPYAGATASSLTYAISKDFTPILGLYEFPDKSVDWPQMLTENMRKLEGVMVSSRLPWDPGPSVANGYVLTADRRLTSYKQHDRYGSAYTITATADTTVTSGGIIRDYSVDFLGGQGVPAQSPYSTTVRVYLPPSYTDGVRQKWALLLHGGGQNHTKFIYAGSPYLDEADTHGMVLVAPNGLAVDATPANIAWFDLPYPDRVNRHLEDAEAMARAVLNLRSYKPALYGMSLGGWKTLYSMVYHHERYSAFAASCPPVDFVQWNYDDNAAGIGGIDHLVSGTTDPDGSGVYPTGDAFIDNLWVQNSINRVIANASLGDSKLWVAYGDSDAVLDYSHHYTPLIAAVPAQNLYASHLVASGTHRDYGPDYISEIFTFLSDEARLAADNLYSTFRVHQLGNNPTAIPNLIGYAGFASWQPTPTHFTGVNTAASGSSGGAGITLLSDDGAAISSGDRLGFVLMGGAKNASHVMVNGAGVSAFADGDWSSTSTPAYFKFQVTPVGSTSRVDALTIGSNNYITIGTGGRLVFPDNTYMTTANTSVATGAAGAVQISDGSGNFLNSDLTYNGTLTIGGADGYDSTIRLAIKRHDTGLVVAYINGDGAAHFPSLYVNGTAVSVGTGASQIPQMDSSAQFPAVTTYAASGQQAKFIGANNVTPVKIERLTGGTNANASVLNISDKSSGDMADGFGGNIQFLATDTGATDQLLGNIGYVRAGADNTGDFCVRPSAAGTATEHLRVVSTGSIILGAQSALATNATAGFVYVPTCAGTPTGAPTAYTGKVALVYDTTNNKLYVYNGAWKGATHT